MSFSLPDPEEIEQWQREWEQPPSPKAAEHKEEHSWVQALKDRFSRSKRGPGPDR